MSFFFSWSKHGISQLKSYKGTFTGDKSTYNSMYFCLGLFYNFFMFNSYFKTMTSKPNVVYSKDNAVFKTEF